MEIENASGEKCTGTGKDDSVRWLCTDTSGLPDTCKSEPESVSKGYGVYFFANPGEENVGFSICPTDKWLNKPENESFKDK